MSKNNEKSGRRTFSLLWEKNIFVFGFSLIIAVILWSGVSMFQTTEVEQQFKDIKIDIDASALEGTGLKVFGTTDLTVDVTVRGKSYLVKDNGFANNITAVVSLDAVETPGNYPLPVKVTVSNANVEIVEQSKDVVTLYFDRLVTKDFPVEVRVIELADYKLDPARYVRGEAELSARTVKVEGPSNELGRLESVIATVTLNEELTETVADLKADLSFQWIYQTGDTENIKIADGTEIFVTIPVSIISEYTVKPVFTNVPDTFDESAIVYTVTPETVKVTAIETDDNISADGGVVELGPIDFRDLAEGTKKTFTLKPVQDGYTFEDGVSAFTVTVDMSEMGVRWLTVNVKTDGLPAGCTILNSAIPSVQIICPKSLHRSIDTDDVYAVVRIPANGLTTGTHEVPVDIYLNGSINYWIEASYSVTVNVP